MTPALIAVAATSLVASLGGGRVLASFVAYMVAFGLARALANTGVAPVLAYQVVVIAALIDGSVWWSQLREAPTRKAKEADDVSVELKLAS